MIRNKPYLHLWYNIDDAKKPEILTKLGYTCTNNLMRRPFLKENQMKILKENADVISNVGERGVFDLQKAKMYYEGLLNFIQTKEFFVMHFKKKQGVHDEVEKFSKILKQ